MASVYDVDTSELIEHVAVELKKIETIKPPVWASFVKTGASKERPPMEDDWWYKRAASVLRYTSIKGPVGVQKLRIRYGGKKNRGYKKERFYRASGNILRKILQQLEKSGLVKQDKKGFHKGRVITAKGKSMLDKSASTLVKKTNKKHIVQMIGEEIIKEAKEEVKIEVKKEKKEPKKEKVRKRIRKKGEKKETKNVEQKNEEQKKEEQKIPETDNPEAIEKNQNG